MTDFEVGMEFLGLAGITKTCVDSIYSLLQTRRGLKKAFVLSCNNIHAIVLEDVYGDKVAIRSGFSSGYRGEGPEGFSLVLSILDRFDFDIEEYDVGEGVIKDIDTGNFAEQKLDKLTKNSSVQPSRIHDYIFEKHYNSSRDGGWAQRAPLLIPLGVVDKRLIANAIGFWTNPDSALMDGYRQLEDIIRRRINSNESSGRLLSEAFGGPKSKLHWENILPAEAQGRANLITGAYMAFRNPRAHRTLANQTSELVREFLLLNQIYVFEHEAVLRPLESEEDSGDTQKRDVHIT